MSPPAADSTALAATIARDLLDWYDRSRRTLPWRALPGERSDPYAVWLSEIMLQQTTVQAVKPYFAKFLALWPTVTALAAAPLDDVMRAWAGLGYYSRARNLHATAVTIARDHGGRLPDTEAALRALPGVGAYTAAAVAAIAFGRDAVVVDGNVERVMARLAAIDEPVAQTKALARQRMAEVTPRGRAGDFAQAVMDLGATLCTPRSPACTICPIMTACRARAQGLQAVLPRPKAKTSSPLRHGLAYYIVDRKSGVLVRRRPPTGLLGGMIELPGTAWPSVDAEPPPAELRSGLTPAGRVTHTFTHFKLFLDVVTSSTAFMLTKDEQSACWSVPDGDLDREALPTLMRNAVALARTCLTGLTRPDRDPGSRKRRRN